MNPLDDGRGGCRLFVVRGRAERAFDAAEAASREARVAAECCLRQNPVDQPTEARAAGRSAPAPRATVTTLTTVTF
jgi:hypothetical protein